MGAISRGRPRERESTSTSTRQLGEPVTWRSSSGCQRGAGCASRGWPCEHNPTGRWKIANKTYPSNCTNAQSRRGLCCPRRHRRTFVNGSVVQLESIFESARSKRPPPTAQCISNSRPRPSSLPRAWMVRRMEEFSELSKYQGMRQPHIQQGNAHQKLDDRIRPKPWQPSDFQHWRRPGKSKYFLHKIDLFFEFYSSLHTCRNFLWRAFCQICQRSWWRLIKAMTASTLGWSATSGAWYSYLHRNTAYMITENSGYSL